MGGRGKGSANAGAAASPLLHLPNGTRITPEIAKQLGFRSIDEMFKAMEARDFIAKHQDAGRVVKYISDHRGLGSLGPIMLRIGLPRNKLLDIVHALKPLQDHGILSATMPFSFKGFEDPFSLASSSIAHDAATYDALAQTEINTLNVRLWLKRIKNVPIGLMGLQGDHKSNG